MLAETRILRKDPWPQSKGNKLKMFINRDPETAAREYNEWNQENAVHIQHITQSQSERSGNFLFVLSVFYTDKTE